MRFFQNVSEPVSTRFGFETGAIPYSSVWFNTPELCSGSNKATLTRYPRTRSPARGGFRVVRVGNANNKW
jgi:hypothetical protein